MTYQLPDHELSATQFLLCGFLAEKPRIPKVLRRMLEDLGWKAQSPGALNVTLRRFEQLGYVVATEVEYEGPHGTEKQFNFLLTRKGFQVWRQQYDFMAGTLKSFDRCRKCKSEKDFLSLGDAPPRSLKEKDTERAPTPEEQQAILEASKPEFRAIYEFSLLANVRIMDLINAKIESVNFRSGVLMLEPKADSGRAIKHREVKLIGETSDYLRRVIGPRKTGPIFIMRHKGPWSTAKLSQAFRRTRDALGIADDVRLSGRGGHLGKVSELERLRDRDEI